MKRKIFDLLVEWKNSEDRKPLIVSGARQVGKTSVLEKFGKEYFENVIYLNMEIKDAVYDFIEKELSPHNIIQFIESVKFQKIIPQTTLIFFDEIQASKRALTLLEYFCEQMPEYYVVAASSFLDVVLDDEEYSFPMYKVNELHMFPLDFEEFLWALGYEKLAEEIRSHYAGNEAMPEELHNVALELCQKYFIVGGLPAVVKTFVATNNLLNVLTSQKNVLYEYIADMSKYSKTSENVKIRACYDSVPAQLTGKNAKFLYKMVQDEGTATIFGEAVKWLYLSGITFKCQLLKHGFIPIDDHINPLNFKLYMGDVGILTSRYEVPLQTILATTRTRHNSAFLSAITENYVAQCFKSKNYCLAYWHSDGSAEVDFVLQINGKVVPVDVKKDKRNRTRSLTVFMEKYEAEYAIRISKKNFGFTNKIKLVPLYAVFCV